MAGGLLENELVVLARYRSMDDLGPKQEKSAGLELVKLLREAEKFGFTSEDVQVSEETRRMDKTAFGGG